MSGRSKINPIEKVKTVEQYFNRESFNRESGMCQASKELRDAYTASQILETLHSIQMILQKSPVQLLLN